jgi:hypothetical protein
MASTPHYLRVARALALVSSLAGVPACSSSTTPPGDGGSSTPDAFAGADSGGAEDAGHAHDSGPAPTDSGPEPADSGSSDGGVLVADGGPIENDAGEATPCDSCVCEVGLPIDGGGAPTCESIGRFECCAVIGPLFPPDLAA